MLNFKARTGMEGELISESSEIPGSFSSRVDYGDGPYLRSFMDIRHTDKGTTETLSLTFNPDNGTYTYSESVKPTARVGHPAAGEPGA